MRISLLLGAVVLPAVLLAGCGDGVEHVGGAAAPVTAAPSTVPTSAPSYSSAPASAPASTGTGSPSAAATETASATRPATMILGPKGFGALKLGMSASQATATGLITTWAPINPSDPAPAGAKGCNVRTSLKRDTTGNGWVYYSTELGVDVIDAFPGVATPEGISIGSTRAALLKAYPSWKNVADPQTTGDGRGYVKVPGNSAALYRIAIANGFVTQLTLQHAHQDCYE